MASRKTKPVYARLTSYCLAILVTLCLAHTSPIHLVENALSDWRIAYFAPTAPKNIIIVRIDEDTYQDVYTTFPESGRRSPFHKDYLGNLLKTLDAAQPKAIGIDMVLDDWPVADEFPRFQRTIKGLDTPIVGVTLPTPLTHEEKELSNAGLILTSPLQPSDGLKSVIRNSNPNIDGKTSFASQLAQYTNARTPIVEHPITFFKSKNPKAEPFLSISAKSAKHLPAHIFEDKFILIGRHETANFTNANRFNMVEDLHETPLRFLSQNNGETSGIEVHAHTLATYTTGTFITPIRPYMMIILVLLAVIFGVETAYRGSLAVSIVFNLMWAGGLFICAIIGYASMQVVLPIIAPTIGAVSGFAIGSRQRAKIESANRVFIQSAFERYVSPKVIAKLIANPDELTTHAETRELTILVTDIENFSSLVNTLEPNDLQWVMNTYFERMINILWEHEATIDKIVGDGIYAFFGAPTVKADHAKTALECAEQLHQASERFRTDLAGNNHIALGRTRIGVASGSARVGNFGTTRYFNYTAYGIVVVIAARLQHAAKTTKSGVLIDPICAEKSERQDLECVDNLSLRGLPNVTHAFTFKPPNLPPIE